MIDVHIGTGAGDADFKERAGSSGIPGTPALAGVGLPQSLDFFGRSVVGVATNIGPDAMILEEFYETAQLHGIGGYGLVAMPDATSVEIGERFDGLMAKHPDKRLARSGEVLLEPG